MTTDQEAENVTASVHHLLVQRGIDAREWERQSKQWEGVADAQRKELEELKQERDAIEAATIARIRQSALTFMAMPPDATDAMVVATFELLPADIQPVLLAGVDEIQKLYMERDELRAALEQIANRDDAEMSAARTLHYDMRGWARSALARAAAALKGEATDAE